MHILIIGLSLEDISCQDKITNKITYTSTSNSHYNTLPKHFISIESWPKITNTLCLNCREPFDSIPVIIPTKAVFADGILMYKYVGCFCKGSCAKRYLHSYKDPRIDQRELFKYDTALLNFVQKLYPDTKHIEIADHFFDNPEYTGQY